jgi:hypothetical protein
VYFPNPIPTHPPTDFFFYVQDLFVCLSFRRYSVRRVPKHHKPWHSFLQKVHVEKVSQKNQDLTNKNLNARCPSICCCFVKFWSVSRRWEFKNTTKNFVPKARVEKFLQTNRQKIQNRVYLGFVGFSRPGEFIRKKYPKKMALPFP